jgi:hypothetical protein
LVATPPYAYPTGREIALHALAIDRAANLPVMLYNYPGRMGVNMDEEFLDRLGRSPNFCAIKESSGDINRVHMLARDYPHIQLSCGMDDQALEFFAWGARSWVCAGSNFAPEAHVALYRGLRRRGRFHQGPRIMSAMMPLMRVLEQGGKFVQCIKHGLTCAASTPGRRARRCAAQQGRQARTGTGDPHHDTAIQAIETSRGIAHERPSDPRRIRRHRRPLTPPRKPFIDGKFRPGALRAPRCRPSTRPPARPSARSPACGAKDVDFAVKKAREAFDQGRWSKLHPAERKDVLIRLCKLITRNRRELAVMESLDSGKPIYDCETIDIPETIHCLKWHAEADRQDLRPGLARPATTRSR